MRTVTRTWTTKTGKTVTRTYTYDTPGKKRGGKSLLLVGKNGRQYKDRISESLASITDPGMRSQARVVIKQAIKNKEKLSIRKLTSILADTKEEKFLINMGYTRESFREDYGFDASEFIKDENWIIEDDKKVFTYGGIIYDLIFDYTDQMLIRRA